MTHSQYKYDNEKSQKKPLALFNVLTTSELSCASWEVFTRGNNFKEKGTSKCVNKGLNSSCERSLKTLNRYPHEKEKIK